MLKCRDNYIIITHSSPDGDTLGSGFALYYSLCKIGKNACLLCPEDIPKKYNYFTCITEPITENYTVIAVDVASTSLMGHLEEKYGRDVYLCIDHHKSNSGYSENLLLDVNAAACCEIIYRLICELEIPLDDITASALYTGISTDTGCFKYGNVTKDTHIIASKLYEYNLNAADINRIMFDTKSPALLELERMVLEGAEYHFDGKCMLLCITKEMQNSTGCTGTELEGIASISRCVQGVLIGVTIKQIEKNEFKISLRTYPPVDASKICVKLGGGGHTAAAGATLKGNLEYVKSTVLALVKDAVGE